MSFLASAPYRAQCALRNGGLESLIFRRRLLPSFLICLRTSNLRISPLASSSSGSLQGQPKYVSSKSFSTISYLQRRWMERQQPSNITPKHQPPQQSQAPTYVQTHLHTVLRTPPTTWARAYLVTYAVIGVFIAIWCGHNYSEGGSVLPHGVPLPKPPGWDRICEFLGFQKPKFTIDRRLQTLSSAALEIKNNFSTAALSYRTSDYPPALTLRAMSPFFNSIFTHFEPLHLALDSYFAYAAIPSLMMLIGIPNSLAVFVVGGFLGTQMQCAADKAYALNQAPQIFKYIKAAQWDPDPDTTLGVMHIGASGGLLAVATVRTLASKQRSWRFVVLSGVTLDSIAYYLDLNTGISHSGHLGGVVSGALLWFGWLRWTKVARAVSMVGFRR